MYCGPPQFTLIGGTDWTVPGWTENEELTDDPFKLAVVVTVPEALAAETLTAKVAVVCPDATVTEAGVLNVIPVAAAASETTAPEAGAAALSVRVHEAEAGAVIEVGEQTIERTTVAAGTGWTENEELTDDPFKLAVVVTVPAALAAETLTRKVAVVCPTPQLPKRSAESDSGCGRAERDDRPGGRRGALSVRVQEAEAGAAIDVGEQASS